MRAICTNVELFTATSKATASNYLDEKLADKHPHQPRVEFTLDQDPTSRTFMKQIPFDPGNYLTSTAEGNGPVQVSGRVALAKASTCGECVTAGSHVYSSAEEVEQELARQESRRVATAAEDMRIAKGKQIPFHVTLPGVGSK